MFSTLQLIIAIALVLGIVGVRAMRRDRSRPMHNRADYSAPEPSRPSLPVVDVDASTPLFDDTSTPN